MGCSSGAVVETTIFAGSEPIEAGDYIGKTFPLRYIGVREGSGVELLRGSGSIRLVDEDVIEVSVGGRSYTLTYDGVEDAYLSSDALAEILNEFPELATGYLIDLDSEYVGGFGFQTALGDMPSSDVVSYYDPDGSTMILSDGFDILTLQGETDLLVFFGTGDVIGNVFANEGVEVEITNGKISGNGFSGGLLMTSGSGDIPLANTDVDGWFYGSGVESVFGTFEGDFVDPADAEGATNFIGGFLAEQWLPL